MINELRDKFPFVMNIGSKATRNGHYRDDYRELFNLTIVALGGAPPGRNQDVQAWRLPPCSQTDLRLRGQVKLTKAEEKNLTRFVLFTVTLYAPAYYEAPLATLAPAHDLAFYRSLVNYMDKEVARKASKAFGRHFWYIL